MKKKIYVAVLAILMVLSLLGIGLSVSAETLPQTSVEWLGDGGWGGPQARFADNITSGKWYNLEGDALTDLANYVLIQGKTLIGAKVLDPDNYVFYFDSNPKAGDILHLKEGLKLYDYTGTADANHNVNGDGDFVAVAELGEDTYYEYDGSTWSPHTYIPEMGINWFGDGGWGGPQFEFTQSINNGKYYNIKGGALDDLKNYVTCTGGSQLIGVKYLNPNYYVLYFDTNPAIDDIITLKAGLKAYDYTGTADGGTHEVNDDGEFVAVYELKNDVSYKLTSSGWELTEEEVPVELPAMRPQQIRKDADYENMPRIDFNIGAGNEKYYYLKNAAKTAALEFVEVDNNTVVEILSLNMSSYVFYLQSAPSQGDKLTISEGLKMYDYTGTANAQTYQVNDDGVFVEEYELKQTRIFIFDGADWDVYVEVDDTPADLLLSDVLWVGVDWGGLRVNINNAPNNGKYYNLEGQAYTNTKSFFEYSSTCGNQVEVVQIKIFTGQHFVFIFDHLDFKTGDIITLKQHMPMYDYTGDSSSSTHQIDYLGRFQQSFRLAEDLKFVYNGFNFVAFTAHPDGFEITNEGNDALIMVGSVLKIKYNVTPEGAYGTPIFTSSNPEIATVDEYGNVYGLTEGEVTITAVLNEFEDSITLEVLPASPLAGVEVENDRDYYVLKGETLDLSKLRGVPVFENGLKGQSFALNEENTTVTLDSSTVGKTMATLEVEIEDEVYTTTAKVVIYEHIEQLISDVLIVDWFDGHLFVSFQNTAANFANFTDQSLQNVLNHLTYQREDGTSVTIKGYYLLGYNYVLFIEPEKDFREGDILTVKQGLPLYHWTGSVDEERNIINGTGYLIIDGYVLKDYRYRFDGQQWHFYKEYEDITATKQQITMLINATENVGVVRVPSDATTGTFTYESSDTSVVTVSEAGVLFGVAEGTATITVTLDGGIAGLKTITVEVTVEDGIIGLKFNPSTINIKVGEDISFKGVKANLLYASGTLGDEVSLENATVSGYDKNKETTQNVTVAVMIDDVLYTGTLQVKRNVEEGCGGCKGSASAAGSVTLILLAGMVALLKKR